MAKRSLSDLPEGMITEVLLRLPVKSLLQCKSVCKPWLSTISNPHFVKSQLHRAIAISRNDPTLLNIINVRQLAFLEAGKVSLPTPVPLFPTTPADLQQQQRQRRRRQLVNQALADANAQDFSTSRVLFDRVVQPRLFQYTRFVGSCNGIICLSGGDVFYLWNPSVRKFKKLTFYNPNTCRGIIVGFGYDSISNDYKVLGLVYKSRDDVVPKVHVYSVIADCYREVQCPILKRRFKHPPPNVVVNGVLYFDGGDELISFDLHKEVFGLIPFPSSIQGKRSDVLDLDGSVAMVFQSGPGIDLWTLNAVSDEFSWTKKFSIEYGLDDLDAEIWLSFYLGAKQFYGYKLLNGNYFVYEILYDYVKKETKCYGLGEEYVNIYASFEMSEIPYRAILEDSLLPVHLTLKYTDTLVALDGFEAME